MKAWCKHLPDVCNDWNWVEMRMGKISRWEDAEIQAGLTEPRLGEDTDPSLILGAKFQGVTKKITQSSP